MLASPIRLGDWLTGLLGPSRRTPERRLVAALRQVPLFAGCSAEELGALAQQLGDLRVPAETPLAVRLATLARLFAADAEDAVAPEAGGLRLGPYRVEEALRAGGMAAVYSAVHVHTETAAALKVLPAAWATDDLRERLTREATLLQRIHHPNVVTVFEVGEVGTALGGGCYLAMEWLPNAVDRALRAQAPEPLAPDTALRVAQGVAEALAAVHAAGLVHRDVKPSNILLRADGTPVLTDFGLAKLIQEHHHQHQLTPPNVLMGTADYLSPEQASGGPVDGRSDLYSLGCVLYELLAGRPPFLDLSAIETLHAHISLSPQPLPESLPPLARMIVERAMQKDPADRFQTAGEMATALAAAIAEAQALYTPEDQRDSRRISIATPEAAARAALTSTREPGPAWTTPELRVEYWEEDAWYPVPCALLDVSHGGVGIVSALPPEVGARIRLVMRADDRALEVAGHLVYEAAFSLPDGRAATRCGVKFDTPTPELAGTLSGSAR